jgi:hypothetical protein
LNHDCVTFVDINGIKADLFCNNPAIHTKLTFFMGERILNKKKIFNDPVYGFISIPDALHFDIIEHPYFQRLRRIKQLGLSHLVYPGALHTRFHHSLGAMHLMQQAIQILRSKGHNISHSDATAVSLAILLHDIGHGPYSHTLERIVVQQLDHEALTSCFLHFLNRQFGGQLDDVISIYNNTFPRKYLSKLVSSQLDMDRLDYLRRDSFFTGVAEGNINTERLITMIDIRDDEPVIEAKGIYSVENFLVARRLMYWQVYLHKTVLSAEFMLMKAFQRARELTMAGESLFATPALAFFLQNNPSTHDFMSNEAIIQHYAALDDYDVLTALKQWQHHHDKVLAILSSGIVNRRLFKVEMDTHPFEEDYTATIQKKISRKFGLSMNEAASLFIQDKTSNNAYNKNQKAIRILYRDGQLRDASEAADQLNISVLSHPVTKHFICYPKNI